MKKLAVIIIVHTILSFRVIGQTNTSVKTEIKKDAREIAGGAKQVWHGVKDGGRTIGHKSTVVGKTIGKGTKKVVKDVRQELKK